MSVMYQAVQDGAGDRGIADAGMPVVDGELAGHHGGAGLATVVNHLQDVTAFC